MATTTLENLRELAARGQWEPALEILRDQDPQTAADALLRLPFEMQRDLFGKMPPEFAAKLVSCMPYFHAYVLLYSRPPHEMRSIFDSMEVTDRDDFLDDLPEEAWQGLMDTLSEAAAEPSAQQAAFPQPAASAPQVAPPATEKPAAEVKAPAVPSREISVAEKPAGKPVAAATTITMQPEVTVTTAAVVPILEGWQIEKRYRQPDGHEIQIISPVDIAIEPNTILALLGPSGCGKSTMLRILSGLVKPSGGTVLWHGTPVGDCQPNVSIVFQSFALFPWLTVLENVESPLLARGMSHEDRHRRAVRALGSVGLANFENAYPKELSGGMKQRVGFARALAVEPEVLFMDEPFSALDVLTAENLRGELTELWLSKKIPTSSIFIVTHNIEEAVLLADRIVVLGGSPARIRADFRVPLDRPRDRKAAAFLLYVDYIYKVMTQPDLELAPPSGVAARKKEFQPLPHSRPGGVAGLLELLVDRSGQEDMYHVAEDLLLEIDDLLPILEAATMLGFATAQEGDVSITPEGRAYAEADIPTRKAIFRRAALSRVNLLQQMRGALLNKSDHSMPVEFFRDLLDEHMSRDESNLQIETALDWGRYADLFTYDSENDRLSLSATERHEDPAANLSHHG
jgi:NitT/TauT family transport system ATP-binding protein